MDQDNSKGQDKRNWRERLGIGAQGSKDLPKISDEFQKESAAVSTRPVATASLPVQPRAMAPVAKPAPMAPRGTPPASRANPKVIQPAPIAPDKLAERLRSQRDASTKLAEQRVQVAKQRAEAQFKPPAALAPMPPSIQTAKPKFTFAEETVQTRPAVAPVVSRPAVPVPQAPAPQLAPARPPLGGVPPPQNTYTPRPQVAPPVQQQQPVPNYPQATVGMPPFQLNYNQQPVPPYRPVDPNSGYAPPPGYVPQPRGFAPPPMQQAGYQQPPVNGPRLNIPQRQTNALNPNYAPTNFAPPPAQRGYNSSPRLNPASARMPTPVNEPEVEFEDEFYDEVPTPRATRPTTTDYKQAYQEAEYGYEDEAPRSKAPWVLAGLVLATMLLAGLGVWLYQSSIKPLMSGQTTSQEVPAVAASETPAKVQAEAPAAETLQPAVAAPTKKQIYDRIVGDQEVLGGEVAPAVETPAAIPEPTNLDEAIPDPAGGAGEEATPLPIPPPPGGTGEQQGSLDPASQKQSVETITPAAGESQAAVAAQGDVAPPLALDPPAPGEINLEKPSAASPSLAPETEAIEDTPAAPKKKPVFAAKKKTESAKPKKTTEKSLGVNPIVLVAPQKTAKAKPRRTVEQSADIDDVASAEGGLYTGDGVVDAVAPESNIATPAPEKKKTLFGNLFSSKDNAAESASDNFEPATPPPAAAKKVVVPETQVASGASGFVVQLASFRSKAEAQTEYARLKAKHSGTLGRFAPIISEASVGGSTRYRLSVGSMDSKAQANAVCSSLFAGGERDCLVKNR